MSIKQCAHGRGENLGKIFFVFCIFARYKRAHLTAVPNVRAVSAPTTLDSPTGHALGAPVTLAVCLVPEVLRDTHP